jgi:protein-L-isoaspartate O-methyltransferase
MKEDISSNEIVGSKKVPDYAGKLDNFHISFEPELRQLIQQLPLSPTMKVADVGCGDGFYTQILSVYTLSLFQYEMSLKRRKAQEAVSNMK